MDGTIQLPVRIYDGKFAQFGVSTVPGLPDPAQRRATSAVPYTLTIVFSAGINPGTTYSYTLQPQDSSGQTIGINITGTFMLQKRESSSRTS